MIWINTIDVVKQAQPCGLGNIGGVALRQFEFPGNFPDEPGVFINQALPCPLIPISGASHQFRQWGSRSSVCVVSGIWCGRRITLVLPPGEPGSPMPYGERHGRL